MNEVITILESEVAEEKWQMLREIYSEQTKNIPETIKQTFLIQSQSYPKKWRILTHWRSQEDLDQMRATEEVPVAVRIFKEVGSNPRLEVWNSEVHHFER